jgi:hypothetical protein
MSICDMSPGRRSGTMPRVLERWRFALDAAVVVVVGLVVAALASDSISLGVAGFASFAAVFVGGACARSYGRALVRALLAAAVGAFGGFALALGAVADPFDDRGGSSPSLVFSLFAFLVISAAMTALTARALTVGWRTRNDLGCDL